MTTLTDNLKVKLSELADGWAENAVQRRHDGDAETDKVWSARQYGFADALEDAARALRAMLGHSTPDFAYLLDQWGKLAEQAAKLAESDDNRITVAYRRAGNEGYLYAANALEQAIKP